MSVCVGGGRRRVPHLSSLPTLTLFHNFLASHRPAIDKPSTPPCSTAAATAAVVIPKENNFQQPGQRYRSWDAARQDRFVGRIADLLGHARCTQVCVVVVVDAWVCACAEPAVVLAWWRGLISCGYCKPPHRPPRADASLTLAHARPPPPHTHTPVVVWRRRSAASGWACCRSATPGWARSSPQSCRLPASPPCEAAAAVAAAARRRFSNSKRQPV